MNEMEANENGNENNLVINWMEMRTKLFQVMVICGKSRVKCWFFICNAQPWGHAILFHYLCVFFFVFILNFMCNSTEMLTVVSIIEASVIFESFRTTHD